MAERTARRAAKQSRRGARRGQTAIARHRKKWDRAEREPQILIITGLSGSGKTNVARALEDIGWFCVDNLPSALIPRFAEMLRGSAELHRSALVVDMREREFLKQFPHVFRQLRGKDVAVSVLFLEADEKALVRRFSETRRPHPLAINQPAIEGIREEREALRPIRKMADMILDTSDYTVHELRDYVKEHYDVRDQAAPLVLGVMSFGYKYGVPSEADLVFDVRFLDNPHWVPDLRPQTGQDPAVQAMIRRDAQYEPFMASLFGLLEPLLPRYNREGKSYLTIAVGCTGGKHRSVFVAETLAAWLDGQGTRRGLVHRDMPTKG